MNPIIHPSLSRRRAQRPASLAAAAALTALLTLAGCVSNTPAATDPEQAAAAPDVAATTIATAAPVWPTAPAIAVPPGSVGTWYDLGLHQAPWLAGDGPVPVGGANASTRVAGLQRDADGHWLALVLVQVAPPGDAPCPAPTRQSVLDPNGGRGCLRLVHGADVADWLKKQNSALWHWVDARGLTAAPRAWVAYRVQGGARQLLEVHVLADPALLEPVTRTNADFLEGGRASLLWVQRLALAAREAARGDGGALVVPPFPFAPRAAVAAATTPPASAAPQNAPLVIPTPAPGEQARLPAAAAAH
jgi:hypothetical protein